jgi:hypothetical protein
MSLAVGVSKTMHFTLCLCGVQGSMGTECDSSFVLLLVCTYYFVYVQPHFITEKQPCNILNTSNIMMS